MAGDVLVKLETPNSCCASWKNKYSKLEEKRNALRQAVKLLEQQIDKIQVANKKVCEEERARADFERESKEKESSCRVALENEVAALKSQILSLKEKGGSDNRDVNSEVKVLQGRVAEGEREIKRLNEAVRSERKKAEVEKKKSAEALKGVEVVKSEKEIAERYRLQIDVLRKEADEIRSKLDAETAKLSNVNEKLEAEKKKVVKETIRADSEKSKAEDLRKRAEVFRNKALEGKKYAETLSRQLEESKKRIDEARDSKSVLELSSKLEEANKCLQLEKQRCSREKERADDESAKAERQEKIAEGNLKKAMEEKFRADNLWRQLEDDKAKIAELEKQVKEISSSNAARSTSDVELKFLKKQLKFEKMKRKHAKQVVELERSRNSDLQQEVARLKLEFDQFSCRLDLLHKSFSPRSGNRDGLQKNGNSIDMRRSAINHNLTAMDISGSYRQTLHTARLSPVPGGICVEPITGTNSKLESLLGGSTRSMLKTPAINSSTTSFSNGQLVGSQDKGAFSVTTSAKLVDEQPSVSEMSDEVTAMKFGENLAVVAENSVRVPVSSVEAGKISMHTKKRKRILDTVETIGNLYIKDKKLHLQIEEKLALLHGFVDKNLDKGVKEGKLLPSTFLESSGTRQEKSLKKRKTSIKQKLASQHAPYCSEQKKSCGVKIQGHVDTELCRQASPTGADLISREANVQVTQDFNGMDDFEKLANGDYMDLLNLDDADFEECYRVAMEIPLSPTLPEIEIDCAKNCDVDSVTPFEKENLHGQLSNKVDMGFPLHGFVMELSSSKSNYDGTATPTKSLQCKEQSPVNTLGIGTHEDISQTSHAKNASVCLNHSAVGDETYDATGFRFREELGLSDKILQRCIILSCLTDRSSISRIYYTIRTCTAQFSLATQTGWMVREILLAIKMEEKLVAKEKACAIFSLLMINFSVASLGKFGNSLNWPSIPCLDSFAAHVHSVMSAVEVSNIYVQPGCMTELLSLIEKFIMDEGIKVGRDVSLGSSVECDSSDNIQINGSNMSESFTPASAEQLVAGSIILASFCTALNHTGLMCELSYNILRSHRLENLPMLTILHIFAYLGGDKLFRLRDYSLIMTVLRPVVRSIEELSISDGSCFCNPFAKNDQTGHGQGMKCPFLEDFGDAMSMEVVTSLLLEKVEADDELQQMHQHEISANSSHAFTTVAPSNLSDLLALLELIAFRMGWDWTYDKIVPRLSTLLQSSIFKNSSQGIVILIGQIGRLGIKNVGYEDKNVEQIKSSLSSFLQRGITMEAGLPIQLATVFALSGLISVDFAAILQTNEKLPGTASSSDPVDVMRKWFNSLNKKGQDLSLKALHPGTHKI